MNAWSRLSEGAAHLVKACGRGDLHIADELKGEPDLVSWGSTDGLITAAKSSVHLRKGHLWLGGEDEHEQCMESETVLLADVVRKFSAAPNGAKVFFEDELGDYDCPLEELVSQVEDSVATQVDTDEESDSPTP